MLPGAGRYNSPTALLQMMTGYWASKALYVAAKLGIADLLSDGPATCDSLASMTATHAPSLYRVMRALAGSGLFSKTAKGHFSLTPMGALLQTKAPNSMRGWRLEIDPKIKLDEVGVEFESGSYRKMSTPLT